MIFTTDTMKTVFLIDDDSDDREIFEESLSSLNLNLNFVEAKNGAEALKKLEQPDFKKPDLIFLDLNMPIMDGRQFLVAIKNREHYKDIPVVIYSTSSNEIDKHFARENDAAMFMTKQYSLDLLKSELSETLQTYL